MEKNILKNGEFYDINAKYVAIGTGSEWSHANPFLVALNTEDDFDANGLDYEDFKNMKVGETKKYFSICATILMVRTC